MAMHEIDVRIDADTTALIEAPSQIDEDNVIAVMRTIRASLVVGVLEDERTIRLRVLDLLAAQRGPTARKPYRRALTWISRSAAAQVANPG
jgi:hypothetical protein